MKISRWNDINFWAMKAAVEKSHKTVHKLCKKFQVRLSREMSATLFAFFRRSQSVKYFNCYFVIAKSFTTSLPN